MEECKTKKVGKIIKVGIAKGHRFCDDTLKVHCKNVMSNMHQEKREKWLSIRQKSGGKFSKFNYS